jgi:hypothetical protein
MVSPDFAQIMSLHAGEAYAMQNLTRTDRLGLLLSGKVRLEANRSERLNPLRSSRVQWINTTRIQRLRQLRTDFHSNQYQYLNKKFREELTDCLH